MRVSRFQVTGHLKGCYCAPLYLTGIYLSVNTHMQGTLHQTLNNLHVSQIRYSVAGSLRHVTPTTTSAYGVVGGGSATPGETRLSGYR